MALHAIHLLPLRHTLRPQLPVVPVAQRQRAHAPAIRDWKNVRVLWRHVADASVCLNSAIAQDCAVGAAARRKQNQRRPSGTQLAPSRPLPLQRDFRLQSIGQLSQLIALNLDGNAIQVLPYEVFMLTSLKVPALLCSSVRWPTLSFRSCGCMTTPSLPFHPTLLTSRISLLSLYRTTRCVQRAPSRCE